LPSQFSWGQYCLLKQNISEGCDPPFVVRQFANGDFTKAFDAATFLLCVDDLMKVEDVCERVAALLPGLQLMLDLLDGPGLSASNIIGKPIE
jgi:hypothetical protein